MARKLKYKPGRFEATGEKGETYAIIYSGMLKSAAYRALTKNQRLLYVHVKMQLFGKRKPAQVYKGIPEMQDGLMIFFSMGDAEREGLYTRNNEKSFRSDMRALKEHGFIELIANNQHQRKKAVYKLSDKWQDWSPDP